MDFWHFFRIDFRRALQRGVGPPRYYSPTTRARRATHPTGANRPPPLRGGDREFIAFFTIGMGSSAVDFRQSKWPQLEGVTETFFIQILC